MITPWDLDANMRAVVLDFAWLSVLLLCGAALRRYVPLFQKFLVPNNIIAGFIGLIIGPQLLAWADLDSARLGLYVYHALALVFIAIGLRQKKTFWGTGPMSTGLAFISTYLIQATIGLSVAMLLVYTIMPDLFPGIGLLVPLGFGMGPGLAYTMGHSWEHFGFAGGGSVGLTFAAIGFLIAYFAGIALIRRGIRKGETKRVKNLDEISDEVRKGVHKVQPLKSAGQLTIASEAMESLAFQLALIGALYLVTWFVTRSLAHLMIAGGLETFTPTLWSFHFIFANLLSLGFRKLLDATGKSHVIDQGLMTRAAGMFMDYLVAASIAAISLVVVWHYWLPLTLMSIMAGFATYFWCRWLMYRAFNDEHFERFIGIFGEMTGTLNSGLVLLRVTDPEFSSLVAEDLVYGSGVALLFGFPLLVVLNLPMNIFNNTLGGYWITLGIIIGYFLLILAIWRGLGYLRFRASKPAE